ncbi:hypothetical protein [Candidatus Lokiarchaeum ossiferum]|uniref:hypothetical protein n=1 Tax=Candidatus Lokiarchaeum ossiferum TaxID=2951803 RepID=UPI00352F7011
MASGSITTNVHRVTYRDVLHKSNTYKRISFNLKMQTISTNNLSKMFEKSNLKIYRVKSEIGKYNPKHQKKKIEKKKVEKIHHPKQNQNQLFKKKKYNSQDRPLGLNKLLGKKKFDFIFYDGGNQQDSLILKNSGTESLNLCSLCKIEERSEKSHIIPKFIGRDIRKRSKTGFLRNQDGKRGSLPKFILLCRNCEQTFSKYEDYFARHFYHAIRNEKMKEMNPFDKKKQQEFLRKGQIQQYLEIESKYGLGKIIYDENLLKFLTSISWRLLSLEMIHARSNGEIIPEYMAEIEQNWRSYLLGNSSEVAKKHYLILTTIIADDDMSNEFMEMKKKIKPLWELISQKSTALGFSSEKNEFIYCNIPGLLMISTLKEENIVGYQNSLVEKSGIYQLNQEMDLSEFNMIQFLIEKYSKSNIYK